MLGLFVPVSKTNALGGNMKTRKFGIVFIAVIMVLTLCLTAACNHSHQYTKWNYNATEHWKECPDDGEIDETSRAAHSYGVDGKCTCGGGQGGGGSVQSGPADDITTDPTRPTSAHQGHDIVWQYDAMQHWKYCNDDNVADMTTYAAHTFNDGTCECGATEHTDHDYSVWRHNASGHWKACSICGAAESATVTPHVFTEGKKVCECGALEPVEYVPVEPDPNPNSPYILVGQFGGVQRWTDALGIGMEQDGSNWKITKELKAGDQWKIKKRNISWDDWEIKFSATKNITPAAGVVGAVDKVLFKAGENGNFVVNYNCTITISHNGNASAVNILVQSAEGVPTNVTEYKYTFHLYAPNWTAGVYIYAWGPIGGQSPSWKAEANMINEGGGWYSYTYTFYEPLTSLTGQCVIFASMTNPELGGPRLTLGGNDDGAGPEVTLKTDMYFNVAKGNQQFDTKEAALA